MKTNSYNPDLVVWMRRSAEATFNKASLNHALGISNWRDMIEAADELREQVEIMRNNQRANK